MKRAAKLVRPEEKQMALELMEVGWLTRFACPTRNGPTKDLRSRYGFTLYLQAEAGLAQLARVTWFECRKVVFDPLSNVSSTLNATW